MNKHDIIYKLKSYIITGWDEKTLILTDIEEDKMELLIEKFKEKKNNDNNVDLDINDFQTFLEKNDGFVYIPQVENLYDID